MTEENKTEKTQDEIGATESRLLQAMSMYDENATAEVQPLQDFVAYSGKELAKDVTKAKMFDIVEAIKTVSDPEIPINVYDMGLIYKINQQDSGDLNIDMTLTSPTCPIAGVGKVEVKLIWEPAWTPDKMSDEAKEMLELI